MKMGAQYALEVESAFLAGVQANLKLAGSRIISGTTFEREDHDHADRVRAAMVDRRIYDRKRYDELPHGRGITVLGYESRWVFWKKLKSVTVATVLAPPSPLLDGDATPAPVTYAELVAHVRGVMADARAPHLIGACSPSGFDAEVWNTPLGIPNVHVVLIEPRSGGGWRTGSLGGVIEERLIKLFDPEGLPQKIERIRRKIEERSIDLLTGGLSVSNLTKELDVPPLTVQAAFEAAAKADPELRLSRRAGDVYLYRGVTALPAAQESGSMSLADWIKSLFYKEGDEAQKIEVLMQRRVALAASRDRLYDDIGKLEKRAQQLDDEGRAQPADIVKRRLAAQLANLEKDVSRLNTTASVLSKQINVISTHIHNLELAQTGSAARLPSGEELTEAAVNAEEILEQLAASDQLVSGLEVGLAQNTASDDEVAIMKRWEMRAVPAAEPKVEAVAQGGKTAEPAKQPEPRKAQAE